MKDQISIKKAATINAISKYSSILLNLFFIAFLSRLLSPTDFGIVAIITVFTTFFRLFSDIGFSVGIVQNKTLSNNEINGIYIFTFRIAFLLMFIFILFSYPLSLFYSNPVYIPIGSLLSISLFFATLNMVPNALILKEKLFISASIRDIVTTIITNIIAIIFAIQGFSYYSLIIKQIIMSLIIFIWNMILSKKIINLKFSFHYNHDGLNKIHSLSRFQFLFSISNYFARNLDNLLVSKYIGVESLGFYNKAYQLMLTPLTSFTNVISPVLHPILSEHQNDTNFIYKQYIIIFKVLSLIGIYISSYSFFASKEIVYIILGSQWNQTVPVFHALSISLWFQMTSSSCSSIYASIGNTRLMFISNLEFVCIEVFLIILGVFSNNIVILGWLVAIGFIFKFFIEYHNLIHNGFNKSILSFYKNFIPDIAIGVVLFLCMFLLERSILVNIQSIYFSAFVKLFISFFIYLILLKLTKQDKYLLKLLPKKNKEK